MDLGSLLLTVVVGGIIIFLYWLYSFAVAPFKALSRVGIRGPPPVPFYGNQKMVVSMGRLHFITKMLERYGTIFGYYLGQLPIVVIKDLEVVKEMTVKQFENFQNRPPQPDLLRKKGNTPRGLFNARDTYWKKIRVTLSPTFSSSKMKLMAPLIRDRCQSLESVLAEHADTDQSINVFDIFGKLSMETVIAAAFGRVVDIQRGESDELVKAAKEIFAVTSEGSQLSAERLNVLLSNFPCAVHILRMIYSRSKSGDAYQTLVKVSLAMIKARREPPNAQSHKDLLQLMIDATTDDKKEEKRLTDEEITAQCVAFMAAGYETTGTLLTFTAYLLALNPDIQDQLVSEIKKYIAEHPDASPYDMVQDIPYLDMVVQESLRIYPPAFLTTRHCANTTTIGEVTVPKGAQVIIPIWNIHHDPQYWPQPDKFDPTRFTDEEKAKRPTIAHMPFGWGPRNCIGMRFALMETKLAFISILSKYRFARAPETEKPLQLKYGITMSPKNGVFLKLLSH